ncbi:MAG: hypothetical protein IJ242_10335 [Clostridia bacterium]|nr:hypothetical protein [Clostridia bacterium]
MNQTDKATQIACTQGCIQELCLMNNLFLQCVMICFPELLEKVLQIFMRKHDLMVSMENGIQLLRHGSSRILDVQAFDREGRQYRICLEYVSRINDTSSMERMTLGQVGWLRDRPGTQVRRYLIRITDNDLFGDGMSVYPVRDHAPDTEWSEWEILYVNGDYHGDYAIGCLMHDFHCSSPDDILLEEVWKAMCFFKQNPEGMWLAGFAIEGQLRLPEKVA